MAPLTEGGDLFGDDPGYAPAGQPGGVAAIAASYHDNDVVSGADDGHQGAGVSLVDPAGPVAVAIVGDALELLDGHSRILVDVLPDVGLGEPGLGNIGGVFWTED